MLIEMNRESIQEILSLCEKFKINRIVKKSEQIEIMPFGYSYRVGLINFGMTFEVEAQRDAEEFFKLIHERKNIKNIARPGKEDASYKELLELEYKIKLPDMPE